MDDESGGLFDITLSDSDAEEKTTKSARRTGQTEKEFQAVKSTYSAKVENGNVYKSIKLPLEPDANKMLVQQALHAVEELYFFRQFEKAAEFAQTVLDGCDTDALDTDSRELLVRYQAKCQKKAMAVPT